MISSDINEPVILSSKSNGLSFYLSLFVPILLIGLGAKEFLEGENIFTFLIGIVTFGIFWLLRSKRETHITRKAIYKRVSSKKYETFRFSDLSYSWFTDDIVYFIFGLDGAKAYSISNDANNYEDIRTYLETVSQKHLPYHRYEFALRSELSSTDKLGCLECESIFRYSAVTHWKEEKTKWSFLGKQTPEIPVCPSCKKEDCVIVSRTGKVTIQGLKSLNELRRNSAAFTHN